MNCSEPGDEDQTYNDVDDDDDDGDDDEDDEDNDDDEDDDDDDEDDDDDDDNKKAYIDEDFVIFDWAREQFPRKTTFMLFVIGLAPASPVDIAQLKIPKHDKTKQFLWTAAFFVKERSSWYVYRKVLAVNRHIAPHELPDIYKKLEQTAYTQRQFMRRRKYHVLEYIELVL